MLSAVSRVFDRILAAAPAKGRFAQSVLSLFAANVVAQGLSFAAYPVLTRIFRPDQLGVLSVVLFVMLLLTSLSTLRYEIALPTCSTGVEAGSVLALSFGVVAATSLLMAVVLVVLPQAAVTALGPVGPYRLFVPLSLLAFGTYNVLCFEASRVGRYSDIARTRVSQALVGPGFQIGFGLIGAGTIGLLVGFVIGLASGTLRLSRQLLFGTPGVFSGVSIRTVRAAAWKFRHFPLFSSWAGVLAGSAGLGNVVFTLFYGATVGGFLFLGDRIMLQPLRVSGNAFLQVFVGEAGRVLNQDPKEFARLLGSVLWKQAAVAFVWLGAVFLAAHVAISLVFGHSWQAASGYIDVMLVGYLPTAVAIPANHTLLLMKRQRLAAGLDALRFVALAASIVFAVESGATPLHAVLIFSVTQGVTQCLILAVMYVVVRRLTPAWDARRAREP